MVEDKRRRSRTKTPIAFQALGAGDESARAGAWFVRVAWSPGRRGFGVPLTRRGVFLGRDPEPTGDEEPLQLEDSDVSRDHAVIRLGADGPVIEDLGSTNGTLIGGRRVLKQALEAGTVVRVGRTVLLVDQGSLHAPLVSTMGLVGRTVGLERLRRTIELAAPSALPVLVIGPTGTGKEVVSQAIHQASGRPGELVAVNCGALPANLVENALFGHRRGAYTDARTDEPGAFSRAHRGTLFLDEIGEMPLDAQPKLLRALESGEITPIGSARPSRVDVRVVAATNQPLLAAVEAGRFRDDLYARLAGVVLETPPLSSRRDDILPLLEHFLPPAVRRVPMTADFVEAVLRYDWPRNVRELRRVAERLPVLNPDADRWRFHMLDENIRLRVTGAAPLAESPANDVAWPPTRESLIELLDRCDGNVSRVAETVQRNRKQVYRWMKKLEIDSGAGR